MRNLEEQRAYRLKNRERINAIKRANYKANKEGKYKIYSGAQKVRLNRCEKGKVVYVRGGPRTWRTDGAKIQLIKNQILIDWY